MVDIIITTYNSINTLDRTLSSILTQIKAPKMTVHIIDDNSCEDYDDIINYYKDFLDIKFKKLKKNNGPGFARNVGLDEAKGDYVIFIDSDDVFSSATSVNVLYNNIVKNKCDVVTSFIYEETAGDFIIHKNDILGLHGKIYRKKFLDDNNIRFNVSRSFEDTSFNSLVSLYGAKIFNIDVFTYVWCDIRESITRQENLEYLTKACLSFAENMLWVADTVDLKKCKKRDFLKFCVESLAEIYYKVLSIKDTDIIKKTKECWLKIYDAFKANSDISLKEFIEKFEFKKSVGSIETFLSFFGVDDKKNNDVRDYHRKRRDNGLIYSPYYAEDTFEKNECLKLLDKFNSLDRLDDKRYDLLKKMLSSFGKNNCIEGPIHANWGCKNLSIGDNCYINYNLSLVDDSCIFIGDNVLIGPNVSLITNSHPISPKLRKKKYAFSKDIRICDNAWIGANVTVLPGVMIGKNSVIGAGSVVTGNIPDNVVAYGNPCRIVREISDYDEKYFTKNREIDWNNLG